MNQTLSFTNEENNTVASAIQGGYKFLRDHCVQKHRSAFWQFMEKPNAAATTWSLLALKAIVQTDLKIAGECKKYYKKIQPDAIKYLIGSMPKSSIKWSDEQIVCEGGAKYNKQKNYYSFSASLLPQLFELGVSPYNPRVVNQIRWLINSEDDWKITNYDRTVRGTFTYAMALSTLVSWIREVGIENSRLLLHDQRFGKISELLTGYSTAFLSNYLICTKIKFKVMFMIFAVIISIMALILEPALTSMIDYVKNLLCISTNISQDLLHEVLISCITTGIVTIILYIIKRISILIKWISSNFDIRRISND